ncbi:Tetratricopeptide-like helical [Penicillium coprophilum]|uniref:Tetratricopeptide-like helical n=1 Tax=Penicillium coprophilum TaxID=36646 RepID=UPI00239DEF43|nr:Tetratricopeptide-like helical [Penicillium coprophilum]KAJ5153800.1 Tetratricopeptide-like helical [Penicillium coprophilum]
MPSLRNILHKRDDLSTTQTPQNAQATPIAPEFKLIRSDTNTQEIINLPSHPDDEPHYLSSPTQEEPSSPRRSFQLFHRSPKPASATSQSPPRRERRLSNLLHLDSRSRSNSRDSSANLPADLPQIDDDHSASNQEREALWEKRATVLVQRNPQFAQSGSSLPRQGEGEASLGLGLGLEQPRSRSSSQSRVGIDPNEDINIQEAIRLHEAGDLERSTQMFGQLADPNGANNPLSQVLYGLALRHGWGCPVDTPRAVTYLSAAASNSAAVEAEALRAGYYETAANLGDTDAMNEVGWCYLEGFGGKKDKFKAAKYYRLAEKNGCPTLGNSWIWKDKYNPK